MKIKNLSNLRFGRLLVLNPNGKTEHGHYVWSCICDCGKSTNVISSNLVRGRTSSCGCYNVECTKIREKTHGFTNSDRRLLGIWHSMKCRCNNPKSIAYKYYGGKGISVCQRWMDSFLNFYNDMIDGYSEELTIDRIDGDKGYNPANCRWATRLMQSRNKKNLIPIKIGNEYKLVSEWAEISGLRYSLISNRIKRGWKEDRLLDLPKKL